MVGTKHTHFRWVGNALVLQITEQQELLVEVDRMSS
jgi:hypothetical protein